MNKYFEINETIYDITEKYPEAINALAGIGFENMKDIKLREQLGRAITLEQALKTKKINVEAFEEHLVEIISQNQNKTDSALNEKIKNDKAEIFIQGVLPCPIRIPLLEGFESWLSVQPEKTRTGVEYELQAASMGVNWIKDKVQKSDTADVLSDLFISAGFDLFFDSRLIGKYKKQGAFKDLSSFKKYNEDFENEQISLRDPNGQYSMLGVVPAVFLVNSEELKGRDLPQSWEDILKPEFENSVSLPIQDFDLFNSILLNIYKIYGEEGITKLGKNLLQSMHPSEMVKSHTKKINKPAVTIMPYFFTKMTKNGGPMIAVWPKDGAIISPIFMLSKKDSREKLMPFIEFFTSKAIGEVLSHQGLFPSVHPEVDNKIDKEKKYMWLGWDFIERNDIGLLIEKIEKLFMESLKQEE